MARLYADEDFDYGVVEELRRRGHDVLTVFEDGQANQGVLDEVVLATATAAGRAVLTHNRRHFLRLHRRIQAHAGILICTRDADALALASRIHEALSNTPNLENQLIRIYRPHRP
jgi:hypothetical protein